MPKRGPRLRLVCVNDVYSLQHLPRLATLVAHAREDDPADVTLVTMAGDFLAPSMLSSLDAGHGMVDCMNAVGFTHVTFGNHEDDVPLPELRRRVLELHATWLATNVPGFEPPLPVSDVVTVGAPGGRVVRVGLLGVVMNDPTIYRAPPFGVPHVLDVGETLARETPRLLAEGCDLVIPLTHQSIDDDRALAVSPHVPRFPLLVGGHDHQPFVERVGETWIVKAGSDAVNAVVVDLEWPAEAASPDAPVISAKLVPVAGFVENAALRARVDGHMAAVRALAHATLMTIPLGQPLSSVGVRAHQTTLGTLLCSLMRDAFGADAAIMNGGGIRAAREYAARFTYADLETEVPFPNEIVVARLPGRVLAEAIVASRAHAPLESGGFLQVDDGTIVESGTVTRVAGAPLDPERDYCVALVRDFFVGLDHEEPLVRYGREHPERVPVTNAGREIKQVLVHAFATALWRRLGSFAEIDTNQDGTISVEELAAALARATDEPASEVTLRLLLDAAGAGTHGARREDFDSVLAGRRRT
jgi:2',3'-cyclic-nucleotide 2'-phosphodiesterase (5'-nucleotidase family)